MLVGNRSILHKSPGRFLSGTPGTLRSNFNKPGMLENRYEQFDEKSGGLPTGHLAPSSWSLPRTAGAMSSRNEAVIEFTGSGNAAQGINLGGSTSITFTTEGSAAAVASAVGDASITFTTTGTAVAPFSAVGMASITFTSAGILSAPATISGTSTIVFASGLVTGAIGHMVAEPIDQSLTPDSIALSVWSASSASNNDAGTMGEKLNDAGSAANPWTEVIESGYTAAEILRLLAAYAAGNATGLDGSAAFTGIDGSTVRIQGTVSGNVRTITDINVV